MLVKPFYGIAGQAKGAQIAKVSGRNKILNVGLPGFPVRGVIKPVVTESTVIGSVLICLPGEQTRQCFRERDCVLSAVSRFMTENHGENALTTARDLFDMLKRRMRQSRQKFLSGRQ